MPTKERYKVQWLRKGRVPGDGTIRTVTAQGHHSAKRTFCAMYDPPKGSWISIWPMGRVWDKREFRV